MNWAKDFLLTREWLTALIILVLALIGIEVLKRFLSRSRKQRDWAFIAKLVPSILNLGYVIALRIFLDAAPLSPRVSMIAEHTTYILTVWLFLLLLRHAFLIVVEWITSRGSSSETLQHGFVPLLRNLATLFVFIMGGIMVLKHFNYDVLSLLTALGVGSLAVGLAAKEALSNMISGFVLIMDRNLRPGDRLSFGGTTGHLEEIGLRSTRIRTSDGNTMIVPNFDLVNNRILNLSDPARGTTCTTEIRVTYSADYTVVREICLKILGGLPKVDQTKSKWVNLSSLSEGCQSLSIGCWIYEMDDCGEVLSAFNQQLLKELQSKGIFLDGFPARFLKPH